MPRLEVERLEAARDDAIPQVVLDVRDAVGTDLDAHVVGQLVRLLPTARVGDGGDEAEGDKKERGRCLPEAPMRMPHIYLHV